MSLRTPRSKRSLRFEGCSIRKEYAGQERVLKPAIEGWTKGARGMPEMWEVVSIMRTRTVVLE